MEDKKERAVPLVFITGPTAVGKTEIGIRLARRFQGEILSMDSMQIYRGMDIGTAKVGPEERALAPHHLIDIADPSVRFTVEDYQQAAYRTIREVRGRGRLPIFVGGTGLYMDAVLRDFQFAQVNYDPAYREELNRLYQEDGGLALYQRLTAVDPALARKLRPSDRKKIIRALEVYRERGKPPSQLRQEGGRSPRFDALVFVISDDREKLYARIDQRVVQMLDRGLVEENLRLLQSGLPRNSQAIQAIGYQEVQWYLRGLVNEEEMQMLIQRHSRHYAKRQLTWCRRDPENIWLSREDYSLDQVEEEISQRIQQHFIGQGSRRQDERE